MRIRGVLPSDDSELLIVKVLNEHPVCAVGVQVQTHHVVGAAQQGDQGSVTDPYWVGTEGRQVGRKFAEHLKVVR